MASLQLFTILVLSYIHAVTTAEVRPGEGVFKITGIFPITNTNRTTINPQTGIMMQAAMDYAIEKINTMNDSTFLFGYRLEKSQITYKIDENNEWIYREGNYPTEWDVREGVLQTFLQSIPFLIGPYSSELAYISSILTGTFQLVSISYGATYSRFANFGPERGYMLRTVPSDVYRMRAVMALLKELKWNYVSLVSSSGYDGEREAKIFSTMLSTINVCLGDVHDLPKSPNENNYRTVIEKMKSDKRLRAVIMFTTKEDSRNLIYYTKKDTEGSRFLLLCVYGCTNYVEVIDGIQEQTAGVLSVNLKPPVLPDFKKYFLQLKPDEKSSKFFNLSWEKTFDCSLVKDQKNCTNNTFSEGEGFFSETPVHTVINAVSMIAETLRMLIQHFCRSDRNWMFGRSYCVIDPRKPQMYSQYVYKILKSNAYEKEGTLMQSNLLLPNDANEYIIYEIKHFQRINGIYTNQLVGTWEYTRADSYGTGKFTMSPKHIWHLNNGSEGKEEALCSKECLPGHVRERDGNPLKKKCCWQCVSCPRNNIVENDTCIACRDTEKANIELNKCEPLIGRAIVLKENPVSALITMFSIIGLCFIVVVIAFFVKYNSYRLVRASGRDLCYMILLGLTMLFIIPFFLLAKVSLSSCLIRSGLPGVAFLCVYAPLFLKTNRIYRIFCHAKKSVTRPSLVSSQSLLLLSFGIVVVQILLVGVWFISKAPAPEAKISKDFSYITMHCRGDSSPILLLLNVALSVGFMISCTILAFKTRHFPKNYNEAKVIGITLYITCVAWSIFLPVYFLLPDGDFVREYFMSGVCIMIGYITLFGLFGQRIYLLMFQKGLDNANANLPTWYLSYSDCKDNGDAMMARPDGNGSSDETIA